MSKVVIITGPCGSGKSTVTKRLAEISKRGAVINADKIRHMIKGGYVKPWEKDKEADEQVRLAVRNTCDIANNLIDFGADVFIDDVLCDKGSMSLYKKLLKLDVKIFVLLPSKEVLIKRDESRSEEDKMGERALKVHDKFSSIKDKFDWTVIDSSNLSVEETVREILKKI